MNSWFLQEYFIVEGCKMIDRTRIINDLFQLHEAVLFSVKSLVSSMDIVNSITVKTLNEHETQILFQSLRNLGTALCYMRDGLINLEETDKASLKDFLSDTEIAEIDIKHVNMTNLIDKMHSGIYQITKCSTAEIKQRAEILKQYLLDFQSLVTYQITRENELLRCGSVHQN